MSWQTWSAITSCGIDRQPRQGIVCLQHVSTTQQYIKHQQLTDCLRSTAPQFFCWPQDFEPSHRISQFPWHCVFSCHKSLLSTVTSDIACQLTRHSPHVINVVAFIINISAIFVEKWGVYFVYLCNSRFVQCYLYNWAKFSTIYSKMGHRSEPLNLKNFPQRAAEFGKLCHGIYQNLPRKTVS